jgi:hypothetical protein
VRPAIVITLLLTACGPAGSGRDDAGSGNPDADTSFPDANAIDGAVVDYSAVYGHSGQVLFRLDTETLDTVAIGSFLLGTKSITDIAIDKDDRMLGVTLDAVYEIDVATGAATKLADLDDAAPDFTSLSFIPTDLDDPQSAEILVAANVEGRVFEIDTTDGSATELGSYGMSGAELIRSSGDLFAVHGVGILATVTVGDTLTDADYLARIDPETWNATLLGTGTDWDRIFGVGYWRGKVYGFVDLQGSGGSIVELDPVTGDGTVIDTGAVRWYGAGVTTDAPIVE